MNHNMPDHLKLTEKKEPKYNSVPPKPKEIKEESTDNEKLNITVSSREKPMQMSLKIDSDLQQVIKSRWRTGSTGGSSTKESEIIGKEAKKNSGSPSPSPIGHPHFPMSKAPVLKHLLASNNPHKTISYSNSSNNTSMIKKEKQNNKFCTVSNRMQILKSPADCMSLFKNMASNKKKKNHKGISLSDFSSNTPIGIGNISVRPISVLNKTIYATGLREQISNFPSLMLKKK